MSAEWSTAGKVAIAAYSHRHTIQKYWKKTLAYLDTGRTDVLVTGAPNVGKSILVGQIHGKARELYYDLPEVSQTVETEAITLGQWTQLFRVLPGQDRKSRTEGLLRALHNNDNLSGLIHVVDFGFNLPRDPAIVASLMKRDGIVSIEDLRSRNLKYELLALDDLLGSLRISLEKNGSPKWLLIAVNKIDLFQGEMKEALAYYHPEGTGEFGSRLADLQKRYGSKSIGIHVAPVCAHEVDFSWNDEVRASTLANDEKMKFLREFVKFTISLSRTHE